MAAGLLIALTAISATAWSATGSTGSAATNLWSAVALVAVGAGVVWIFAWRRVLAMKRDLAGRTLATVTGTLDRIDQVKNSQGETITHVTVHGVRFTTRAGFFEGFEAGESVAVDHLPRCRVPLGVRHA